jgi:hypothetical protein
MTNEEINRAIAEHIGADDRWLIVKRGYFYRPQGHGYTSCECNAWVLPLVEAKKHEYLIGEEKVTLRKATIPNYVGDLNAMREALALLPEEFHEEFMHVLCLLHGGSNPSEPLFTCFDILTCKPRVYAEALLRTVDKWKKAP